LAYGKLGRSNGIVRYVCMENRKKYLDKINCKANRKLGKWKSRKLVS